jgi:hypothetical protein
MHRPKNRQVAWAMGDVIISSHRAFKLPASGQKIRNKIRTIELKEVDIGMTNAKATTNIFNTVSIFICFIF